MDTSVPPPAPLSAPHPAAPLIAGVVTEAVRQGQVIRATLTPLGAGPPHTIQIAGTVPVCVGDTVVASGVVGSNGHVIVNHDYLIMPGTKRDTIEYDIARLGHVGIDYARSLYLKLEVEAHSLAITIATEAEVVAYGDDVVSKHLDRQAAGEPNTTCAASRTLLRNWYQRMERRLQLLGVREDELEGGRVQDVEGLWRRALSNPFAVPEIDMQRAIGLARVLGITPGPLHMTGGTIVRLLHDNVKKRAWTCTPEKYLSRFVPHFNVYVHDVVREYGVVREYDCVYLPYQYTVEVEVAAALNGLIRTNVARTREYREGYAVTHGSEAPEWCYFPIIPKEHFKIPTVTNEQMTGVSGAIGLAVSIITGGAGTGKTWVIEQLRECLDQREIPYLIVSFTGKAVSRIHQLLGVRGAMTMDLAIASPGTVRPFKHLIIDETSMVTTELFYRFIRAFPLFKAGDSDRSQPAYNITIVGDIKQLQPISWGTFMQQLQQCERVPIFRLNRNHRIEGGSTDSVVLENANALIHRPDPKHRITFKEGPGFVHFNGNVASIKCMLETMRDGINYMDLCIITPYRQYLRELNTMVQSIYLISGSRWAPKADSSIRSHTDTHGTVWTIGDRVMLTVNNKGIGVMNGEEGQIVGFTPTEARIVFGGKDHRKEHSFVFGGSGEGLFMSQIMHSFAVTAHKAQGSEYRYVIIYIPKHKNSTNSNFINSNLMYMMMTRTKEVLWLVGDHEVITNACTRFQSARVEKLTRRLADTRVGRTEDIMRGLCVPDVINEEDCEE